MSKLLDVIKWSLTLGKEPQNFLGARWIEAFLKRVPKSKKHIWALRIISLSPHYFINPDNPDYKGMSNDEYLQANFEELRTSREEIYRKLLKPYIEEDFTVLDYGCGPGFLAKAVSPFVKKIYAADISNGAIACAKIINQADNIEYIVSDEAGLKKIPDEEIDAVYSFAVVQHLTHEVLEFYLETCRRKLKAGGILVLHIQLLNDIWQTEEHWKEDKSIKGKLKYQYGLHCFGRTEDEYNEALSRHHFTDIKIDKIEDFVHGNLEQTYSQRVLTARRKD